MWRRHRSWQRSHLDKISIIIRESIRNSISNRVSIIFKKSTSSLAAAALETADMTRRKERGVTGIPWDEEEHSSFDAKIASIRSRSDAEHRDCKLKVDFDLYIYEEVYREVELHRERRKRKEVRF